jgi:hypothetical protein
VFPNRRGPESSEIKYRSVAAERVFALGAPRFTQKYLNQIAEAPCYVHDLLQGFRASALNGAMTDESEEIVRLM